MENLANEDIYIRKLKNVIDKVYKEYTLQPLTPDASTRRYFRVIHKGKSVIFQVMGHKDKAIIPEEFVEIQKKFEENPFINIQKYLEKIGVRVPKIIFVDDDVIALEDFGDTPLDIFVEKNGIQKSFQYYKSAIYELIRMQISPGDKNCYAFQYGFTKNVFMWEFNHFVEYALHNLKEEEKEILYKNFEKISDYLSKLPRCFCHRDYHSKNLMCIEDGKVGIIDFQDSLQGPHLYDLVSLLKDAYVEIEEMEEDLKNLYLEKIERFGVKFQNFLEDYELLGIQRMLKASGRFIYIKEKKGNEKFLKYVPRTISRAVKSLQFIGLKEIADIIERRRKM